MLAFGCGILTAFPFAINPVCVSIECDGTLIHTQKHYTGMWELPIGLGPTHPRPNIVRAEPFSTSVHKDLACVFATATKICTDGGSSRSHDQAFNAHRHATLLVVA